MSKIRLRDSRLSFVGLHVLMDRTTDSFCGINLSVCEKLAVESGNPDEFKLQHTPEDSDIALQEKLLSMLTEEGEKAAIRGEDSTVLFHMPKTQGRNY